ncbi:FtsB family cell division protein [Arcanobacterium buesumense]|uniref:Septum formation initiator family protein n=1 Tax=Arcanobacterium buesumense TaxID=2722751 RepID=A0A6H2EMV1_9ACTO|nr:septum formation initiator family protein [Arcanobacterium buesumense]QJC22403.1 septum formation initiator family protein [Arcanobacterium buesumense]
MVRRPVKRSSGTSGSFRAPTPQQHAHKPGSGRKKSKPQSRPSSSRKTEAGSRSRFTREHHLVIQGQQKTHRISLRLATVMLFVLLAVLIVANPLTQYLAQQEEIRKAKAGLVLVKERVDALEEEKALWSDPVFIQAKARERLGFVMPGQTLYTTTDPDKGSATEQLNARTEEVTRLRREQTPFFVTGWDSITVAGQIGEIENPQHTPILNEPLPDTPPESAETPPDATDTPPESPDSPESKDTNE